MFERYTEKARRVIFFARYEANQFGSRSIEPEHILLGIIREDLPVLQKLTSEGISDKLIRLELESVIGIQKNLIANEDLPLSTDSRRALMSAASEADRICSWALSPGHLLFGILKQQESVATKVLSRFGISLSSWPEQPSAPYKDQRQFQMRTRFFARAPKLLRLSGDVLTGAFIFLFIQLVWKRVTADVHTFDIRFYSVALPIVFGGIAACNGALLWIVGRRRRFFWTIGIFLLLLAVAVGFLHHGLS